MNRNKLFLSTLFAIIFLAIQVIAVGAAPAMEETTPEVGSVSSITLETDPGTGLTTVVVVYTYETGEPQTVALSLEEAAELGLVIDDGTGIYVVNETMLSAEAEKEHPVGSALSEFFSNFLGVSCGETTPVETTGAETSGEGCYGTIMQYHEEGAGFGVIAQALWMANALESDTVSFSTIMEAKINKDFSTIEMPDGSTPTNWGQFQKAVKSLDSDSEKTKNNLGAIKSGHANSDSEEDTQTELKKNGKPDKEPGKPDKETGKPDKETGKPDKETGKPDKETGKPDKVKKDKKNKNK